MTPEQNAHVKTLSGKQEIFDYAIKHLKNQGTQSMVGPGHGICGYRGHDGTMCAVGCLLADDEYEPDMEGKGVYKIVLPPRLANHVFLLQELQRLHDHRQTFSPDGAGLSLWGIDEIEELRIKFDLENPRP